MTARILVVDDVPANLRLLEARLMSEYFQVLTATNGRDALAICAEGNCDIVLLDVMMPEMDGFEVCRQIKENPATMHLPVILITALSGQGDRIKGLQAGADDFLTKPVNDLALVTRVKSLARLKMLTDDLRIRASNGDELSISNFDQENDVHGVPKKGKVVVVEDQAFSYKGILNTLSDKTDVSLITNPDEALFKIADGDYDAAIISLHLNGMDSLRLCSHLRSLEQTRSLPIVVLANPNQENTVRRALEIGVNDYINRPPDPQELQARLKTQMSRKRYHDCLRHSVQQTVEMAVKDPLTDLHNRRYFNGHFESLFETAVASKKPLSILMCDIDHFKSVNDTHGHDIGDAVIVDCAKRIKKSIRNIDLACRFGGEEFIILMPDTDLALAQIVAERIRNDMAAHPVVCNNGALQVPITISVGVSSLDEKYDTPEKLMKRADVALYNAKRDGRNRVVAQAA